MSQLGGQLRVVWKGKETVGLDQPKWDYPPSIRWIAFYSDCKHEVLPVTAGHRVTLTYELWVADYPNLKPKHQVRHITLCLEERKVLSSAPSLLKLGPPGAPCENPRRNILATQATVLCHFLSHRAPPPPHPPSSSSLLLLPYGSVTLLRAVLAIADRVLLLDASSGNSVPL
jgi:hypothetical protein